MDYFRKLFIKSCINYSYFFFFQHFFELVNLYLVVIDKLLFRGKLKRWVRITLFFFLYLIFFTYLFLVFFLNNSITFIWIKCIRIQQLIIYFFIFFLILIFSFNFNIQDIYTFFIFFITLTIIISSWPNRPTTTLQWKRPILDKKCRWKSSSLTYVEPRSF